MIKKPPFRKLRGYAFDPSLSLNIDTALINNITYTVPWEDNLEPGPKGEYVEVVDYDPTVKKWYAPVNLNDLFIAAQDGIEPSGSNPQFHQQMVYAVSMTTIKNFESALGRPVLWSPRRIKEEAKVSSGAGPDQSKNEDKKKPAKPKPRDEYVPTLRIYPHALRDANAFYSPQKKALLFGYFSARPADVTLQMPDNLTFACLSHDIIAHETTHAILDGLYRKYTEPTNPDVLAFHEAFSDIVALFQHFTFPDVLKNQIAATRGDLASQNLLGKLAQEFGIAIGSYGALRDAIGTFDRKTKEWKPKEPTGDEYRTIMEPHARGAILVSAVFDAFLTIYKSRVADLLRISTNGTGVLPQGQLQPDLVNRLAAEAAKSAGHVLKMCIRALDYCPPVDITFGDFLRAIITADADLISDDNRDYRIAFIDSFRKRGIYPTGIKNLSVESLTYSQPNTAHMDEHVEILTKFLREFRTAITYVTERKEIFKTNVKYIAGQYPERPNSKKSNNKAPNKKNEPKEETIYGLHRRLHGKFRNSIDFETITGLCFSDSYTDLGIPGSWAYGVNEPRPSFEVHSLHYASRNGLGGKQSNQVIVTLIQTATVALIEKDGLHVATPSDEKNKNAFKMTGGCTLIFDLDSLDLKYAISKPLLDVDVLRKSGEHKLNVGKAIQLHKQRFGRNNMTAFEAYFADPALKDRSLGEPFAFLHTH